MHPLFLSLQIYHLSTMSAPPLEGIRVVELAGLAPGLFATSHFLGYHVLTSS